MSRHILDKSITIPVQHFIVDSNEIFVCHSVTATLALELEGDRGQLEVDAVHPVRVGEDLFDSFDCFDLKFSHAYRLAPCTTRARKKIKIFSLDKLRPGGYNRATPPGGEGGVGIIPYPLGACQAEKKLFLHVQVQVGTISVAVPQGAEKDF